MMRCHDKELGCYLPAFFEMKVDTFSDDLGFSSMCNRDRSIVFHEYIHFLQDFTTYTGLNNNYVYNDLLSSAINVVYENQKGTEFSIPVVFPKKDLIDLQKWLNKVTFGDTDSTSGKVIEKIEYNEMTPPDNIPSLPVIPTVTLSLSGDDFYTFGAGAIMESMAYLMEQLCLDYYELSPDFPYNLATLVVNKLCPDLAKDPLNILALCDVSLLGSNPGHVFIHILEEILNGNITVMMPEDIYDAFYKMPMSHLGKEVYFAEAFENLAETTRNQLKNRIKIPNKSENYHKWVDTLIDTASDLRLYNRYFMIEIARHKDILSNKVFARIVNLVGSPLMENNLSHFSKMPFNGSKGEDVEFLKVAKQIIMLLEDGNTKCELINLCNNSPEVITDDRCQNRPWSRCTDDKLCPYAMLWKHWNLIGYEPKVII